MVFNIISYNFALPRNVDEVAFATMISFGQSTEA